MALLTCSECGAQVQASDSSCRGCGRELGPNIPPSAKRVKGGRRYSDDWQERVEWQLDQIRASVMWVAAIAILSLVGAVLLFLMAATS